MAKRHNDALAIQHGACNPSGIALSIVEACREIRAQSYYNGTKDITSDPAVRLMVHQLAYICGIINGVEDFADSMRINFGDCMEICREGAKVVQEPAQTIEEIADKHGGLPID